MKKKHRTMYQATDAWREKSHDNDYEHGISSGKITGYFAHLKTTVINLPYLTPRQALEVLSNGSCGD